MEYSSSDSSSDSDVVPRGSKSLSQRQKAFEAKRRHNSSSSSDSSSSDASDSKSNIASKARVKTPPLDTLSSSSANTSVQPVETQRTKSSPPRPICDVPAGTRDGDSGRSHTVSNTAGSSTGAGSWKSTVSPVPPGAKPKSIHLANQDASTPPNSSRSLPGSSKRKLEPDDDGCIPSNRTPDTTLGSKRPKVLGSVRHERFWLPEGNVIFQVGGIHFKLHRSRLEQHSEQLTRLFALKQEEKSDMLEGLPLYYVENLTTIDFEHLLVALDEAITYHLRPPPFPVIAGILRAASQLSFSKFRCWAIQRLESMWSSDLNDITTKTLPAPIEVIILGRKYNVPSILKRAFYEVLRSSNFASSDPAGAEPAPGHTITKPISDDPSIAECSMSVGDLQMLILTREKLVIAWIAAAASFQNLSVECPKQKQDAKRRNDKKPLEPCLDLDVKRLGWIKVVHESGLFTRFLYDPICGLDALCTLPWVNEQGYCVDCFRLRKSSWDREREKLWANLDQWLSL